MKITNPYDPRKILVNRDKLNGIIKGELPYPITIEVDLVDGGCNNNCIFCCFHNNKKDSPIFIEKNELLEALRIVYSKGTRGIELVGGSEPTMHSQIGEIVRDVNNIGFEISLVTNGLLLNRIFDVGHFFKYVRISLDAGTRDTYKLLHGVDTFDKVINNVKTITSQENSPQKVGLAYLCLPQNSNEKEIASFFEIANELNVDYVVFRPAILKESWDCKYLDEVGQIIDKVKNISSNVKVFSSVGSRWVISRNGRRQDSGKCLTCLLTGIIKANGDIPLCNLYRNDDSKKVGNIYQDSYDNIWGSKYHRELLDSTDIANCPVPCKADDYRKILNENKDTILSNEICVIVDKEADPNFV